MKFIKIILTNKGRFARTVTVKATLLISLVLLVNSGFSQNSFVFYSLNKLPDFVKYPNIVKDLQNGKLQSTKIANYLLTYGYISASVDSVFQKNDTIFFKIYTGKSYNWGNVNFKYLNENFIEKFGFQKLGNGIVNLTEMQKSMNLTIDYFENKGYPFAYFYWDSLKITNDSISGNLFFEKNYFITFDTIALYGDKILSKKFIYNYLEIKPDQPFSESLFGQISKRFDKLPFATLQKPPQVYFVERKAVILLVLKKKSVNRLDGIAGFAPATDNTNSNKLLLTGEFHIDLKNIKGSGIAIKTDWQSFKQRSQSFNFAMNFPYFLNKPLGLGFGADFLKFDTIYYEAKLGVNLNYIFSGNDFFSLFYEKQSTNLISVDTNQIRKSGKIGSFIPLNNYSYGVILSKNSLNNLISPSRGFSAFFKIYFTKRNITKDNNISNVKFYDTKSLTYYTVYDSLKIRTFQLKIQFEVIKILPIIKNTILFAELKGSGIVSPDVYYNELYRIGGFSTLKGFNEQSLFASSYSIINLELRYLLSENSFVRMFVNGAYYIDKSDRLNKISEDLPIGYGAGFNLETNAGILNLSVAQGKSKFNPSEFRNTKIHIGLINYF